MSEPPLKTFSKGERRARALVALAALLLALASPMPYASWNDGSRLAAVESLVDYRTWAIENSIFVDPSRVEPLSPLPYAPCRFGWVSQGERLMFLSSATGTGDKMWIGGHFYSDKAPVPSLLMAAFYKGLQIVTGLTARSHADAFIFSMTLATAGLAFVFAVMSLHALAGRILPSQPHALAVAVSFAFATAAPAFTRQVNVHIVLLAVGALLMLKLRDFAGRIAAGESPWLIAAGLGTLGGFAYSADLGAGLVLFTVLIALVAYRCRPLGRAGARLFAVFLLSALPWIVLHHALNFRIGGTLLPASVYPENFGWFGSPWTPGRPGSPQYGFPLTGSWQHRDVGSAALYALRFLIGKKGLLIHNPTLLLAVPGFVLLVAKKPRLSELPELLFAAAWGTGTWMIYAAFSKNAATSFRWLLPLLAPAYFVLTILLRERPKLWREFLMLTAGGVVIAVNQWTLGPWGGIEPGFRTALATLLLVWLALRVLPRFLTPGGTSGGGPSDALERV